MGYGFWRWILVGGCFRGDDADGFQVPKVLHVRCTELEVGVRVFDGSGLRAMVWRW